MNIITEDAFSIKSNTDVFTTYIVKSVKGESKRKIKVPIFSCVVGNPPYTRWNEISVQNRKVILSAIGRELKSFELSPGIRGEATEIGLYIDFIVHCTSFLSDGSKLGMIISNSWLQTDYGIKFGKYILEHYKVKAVIDFPNRLFRIPIVATNVLLLERCSDPNLRNKNETVFAYIDKELSTGEILNL